MTHSEGMTKKNLYEIYCLFVSACSVLIGTIFLGWTIYYAVIYVNPRLGIPIYQERDLLSDESFASSLIKDCQRYGQSENKECLTAAEQNVPAKRARALNEELALSRIEAQRSMLWSVIYLVILIPVFLFHLWHARKQAYA